MPARDEAVNHPAREGATYRVQISGWDSRKDFFLETVALEWLPSGGKRVCLRHPPQKNDLVFVRLLLPLDNDHTCPVPCVVEQIIGPDESGYFFVILAPVHPTCPGQPEPRGDATGEHGVAVECDAPEEK
jgi:hypothetical protein